MRSSVFVVLVYCSLRLLQYWLLGLLCLQLSPLHPRRLFQQHLLLREEGVVVFTVTIVVRKLMWRHFASRRRKISLAEVVVVVLHRVHVVLVVLILEALNRVLLVLRHRRCSCCFVASLPLRLRELLVLLLSHLHSQMLLLLLSLLQVLFHGF